MAVDVVVPEEPEHRQSRLHACLTALLISDVRPQTSTECGASRTFRIWALPSISRVPQHNRVGLPVVVVVVAAVARVAAQLPVVAVPLRQQPQQLGRQELQQVRPKLQQPRMPTQVAVAAVGVEVEAQRVAEAARHPSRGFPSCPGPLRSTTTIQRTSPSTIPKATACLPVDRDSMQLLTPWSSSNNLS